MIFLECFMSCRGDLGLIFFFFLFFPASQWHSSSTGSVSSCPSAWPPRRRVVMVPSPASACPLLSGSWSWEYVFLQIYLHHHPLHHIFSPFTPMSVLEKPVLWFVYLQFSTYFPGYFDGQYWLWWVFLVLGEYANLLIFCCLTCAINEFHTCFPFVYILL